MTKKNFFNCDNPIGLKPLDFHADITNMIEPITIDVDDCTEQEKWLKKRVIEALEDVPKKVGYLVRDIDDRK